MKQKGLVQPNGVQFFFVLCFTGVFNGSHVHKGYVTDHQSEQLLLWDQPLNRENKTAVPYIFGTHTFGYTQNSVNYFQ